LFHVTPASTWSDAEEQDRLPSVDVDYQHNFCFKF